MSGLVIFGFVVAFMATFIVGTVVGGVMAVSRLAGLFSSDDRDRMAHMDRTIESLRLHTLQSKILTRVMRDAGAVAEITGEPPEFTLTYEEVLTLAKDPKDIGEG